MTNANEKSSRTRRTPADIASAELEAATKRVEQAKNRQAKAEEELAKAKADVTRFQRLADYAAQNPDLPENGDDGTLIDSEDDKAPGFDVTNEPGV